jgi:hypothetical protein
MAPRGIVIQITGDGASAAAALQLVDQHLKTTAAEGATASNQIATAMDSVKSSLQTLGLTVGIGEAISKMKEMVTSSVELGTQLEKLHQQTGMSTEGLSTLRFASQEAGVDFDMLARGLNHLSVEFEGAVNGSAKSQKAFTGIGISMDEVRKHGGDMYGLLKLIADKFQTMPDGMTKSADAAALFGARMGAQLLPVLNMGSQGLDDMQAKATALGMVLDEQGVQKLHAFHEELVKVETGLQGAGIQITQGMIPGLTTMLHTIGEGKSNMQVLEDFGENISRVIAAAGTEFYALASDIDLAAYSLLKLMEYSNDASLNFKGADFFKQLAAGAKAESDALGHKAVAMWSVASGNLPRGSTSGVGPLMDAIRARNRAGATADSGDDGDGGGGSGSAARSAVAAAAARVEVDRSVLEDHLRQARRAVEELHQLEAEMNEPPPSIDLTNNGPQMQAQAAADADAKRILEAQTRNQILAQQAADSAARMQAHQQEQMQPWITLGQGMEQMGEQMARATGKGREGFHAMVMSMEQDLVQLAVKFAAQKWLTPFLNSLGGGAPSTGGGGDMVASDIAEALGNGHAAGGYMDSPGIVGEEGPEMWVPQGPGTILPNDLLQNISAAGAGSRGGGPPTVNVINQSSQPVTARPSTTSFDADTRQYVTHIILEDMQQGGPISMGMRGAGG